VEVGRSTVALTVINIRKVCYFSVSRIARTRLPMPKRAKENGQPLAAVLPRPERAPSLDNEFDIKKPTIAKIFAARRRSRPDNREPPSFLRG
jgi:hypothetical protein